MNNYTETYTEIKVPERQVTAGDVMQAMEEYDDYMTEATPTLKAAVIVQSRANKLKAKVRDLAVALGSSVSHSNVTVSYRTGYYKDTWDAKALSGYAADKPEMEQFKTTKHVKPSAAVVWKEK